MKQLIFLAVILSLLLISVSCNQKSSTSNKALKTSIFYNVEKECICKGDTVLTGPIREIEVKGPAKYWEILGQGEVEEGLITKDEIGLWMFNETGKVEKFIPLEDTSGIQDIILGPDQTNMVIVEGSEIRLDIFFEVYKGEKKVAELSGVRGTLVWINPNSFIFNQIGDETRIGKSFLNQAYGLYLSIAMYDISKNKVTLLKEATKTHNYYLEEVDETGSYVTVFQESVSSEEDWNNEEKIKEEKIKVQIPN